MYFCSVIVVLWMMGKHCISPVFDPADHHRSLNSLRTAQSYSDEFSLLLVFCTVNPLYSKKKKRRRKEQVMSPFGIVCTILATVIPV